MATRAEGYPWAVIEVAIELLGEGASLPVYANPADGGCDLVATEHVVLSAGGGRALVGTGIKIALPDGYAGFVQPRSGLALRHGVTCLNTPGLIDAGYRGEIKVLLVNLDPVDDYEVAAGDRIAQLVVQRVEQVQFTPVESLDATARADGGFGSSGR
jgi:dUTP pyrophosphatase